MTEIHPATLGRLVRAVAVLALPVDRQVAWLASLGLGDPAYADELALEVADGVLLAPQFVAAGWIRPEAQQLLVDLDEFFSARSDGEHNRFWEVESLRTSAEWARARDMAFAVLQAI